MFITPGNPEHAEFIRRVRERIEELKDQLAGPLDLDETNRVRGAIGELQRIVTDAEPNKAIAPSEPYTY